MPYNPDLIIFAIAKMQAAKVPAEQMQAYLASKGYKTEQSVMNLKKRALENRENEDYLKILNEYDTRLSEYSSDGLSPETIDTIKGVL